MNTTTYKRLNYVAEKNSVIVFGGSIDKSIPVAELSESYEFNFKVYNRSFPSLSVKNAKEAFESCVKPICPEGILIHLGEEDLDLFKNDSSEFDKLYLELISTIKNSDSKTRIALISLFNTTGNNVKSEMNRHIKAIAESEKCDYINLDNAQSWKPESTKEVISFVYSLGFVAPLNIKKPLNDIAKILYSYAYENLAQENEQESTYA